MAKNYNYYNELTTDKDVSIHNLTEDLAVTYRYRPRDLYFINRKEKKAWLVLDSNDKCEVVIPSQPMSDEVFRSWKLKDDRRSMVVVTGMGVHGDEDRFSHDKDSVPLPGKVHQLIADFEKEYKVTVITTCPDPCHEQAGSTTVLHLLNEEPVKEMVAKAAEAVRTADVCILVGCRCTLEPIRNIMQYVKPASRLYLCYFNNGEGKMPRIHNLVSAFAVGTFAPPEDGIDTVIKHLRTFPLE